AGVIAPVTVALGPEGGYEPGEIDLLVSAGFRLASMGRTILRFETAGIASLAMLRTMLAGPSAHQSTDSDD
ncbi:MAG TPA: 16S rRNA (uracil(1498)-N(3))-methyltransferase, partial [Gemmatimonas sp.]|nr:16S rRNA (uracil(1498)-N(3))-methyltransferase [Gemmatimonas sp.]